MAECYCVDGVVDLSDCSAVSAAAECDLVSGVCASESYVMSAVDEL